MYAAVYTHHVHVSQPQPKMIIKHDSPLSEQGINTIRGQETNASDTHGRLRALGFAAVTPGGQSWLCVMLGLAVVAVNTRPVSPTLSALDDQ